MWFFTALILYLIQWSMQRSFFAYVVYFVSLTAFLICKLKSKYWNNASSKKVVTVSFRWKNKVYRNEIIIVTRYVCLSLFFCKFPINFSCPTRFLDFFVLFVLPYWSMVSLTLNMRYVPSNLAVCIMYSPQRNGSNNHPDQGKERTLEPNPSHHWVTNCICLDLLWNKYWKLGEGPIGPSTFTEMMGIFDAEFSR